MDQPLYTFEPNLGDTTLSLWTGVVAALAALAGTVALLRRRPATMSYNAGMLSAMLLFFVFLIAVGVAFFSAWSWLRTGPVRIFPDAVETPDGRVAFDDVRNAAIREETEHSFVNPSLTTRRYRLLVIEERNGKVHVLSEKNYPLNEVMARLKEATENAEGHPIGK